MTARQRSQQCVQCPHDIPLLPPVVSRSLARIPREGGHFHFADPRIISFIRGPPGTLRPACSRYATCSVDSICLDSRSFVSVLKNFGPLRVGRANRGPGESWFRAAPVGALPCNRGKFTRRSSTFRLHFWSPASALISISRRGSLSAGHVATGLYLAGVLMGLVSGLAGVLAFYTVPSAHTEFTSVGTHRTGP